MEFRDIFFDELRKQAQKLKEYRVSLPEEARLSEDEKLYKAVDCIEHFGHIVRNEGFLGLEEAVYKLNDTEKGEYLDDMVMWVVDGTLPDVVQELCLIRFFAGDYDTLESMRFLICMAGILQIQNGLNPLVIRSMLLNMLPMDMRKEFYRREDEKLKTSMNLAEESEDEIDFNISDVKELLSDIIPVDESNPGYNILKLMDESLSLLDDRSIQRFLKELNYREIVDLITGMSVKTRIILLSNVSKRTAAAVVDDLSTWMCYDPELIITSVRNSYDKLMNLMGKL